MISPNPSDFGDLESEPRPDTLADVRAERTSSWRGWLWTTTGIVLMLLLVQFVTGLLLAFYYVPSTDHAHTTVSFIEKALPAGSWIRALHHHGSQWLPLFLFLHLIELFWRSAYKTKVTRWLAAIALLALAMAAGASGYSLPWDVRAFFSTRVAEGIAGGLPLVGSAARAWLLGSNEISTLTLSRLFALHVLVTPFLILLVVVWQLLIKRTSRACATTYFENVPNDTVARPRAVVINQLTRNVLTATAVFVLLALYAHKFPAPLGPPAANAGIGYLPRPGAQFLWLYQTLKYVPGSVGSLLGVVLPGLVLLTFAALPWLDRTPLRRIAKDPRRQIGGVMLSLSFLFVTAMTLVSYANDRRDPRTRQQLARQAVEEAAFRQEPFVPALLREDDAVAIPLVSASPSPAGAGNPPAAFTKLCVSCHGEHGEGARQGPLKFPALLGVSAKPRRSLEDIIGILNDPTAYGLEPPMKSFATKLTEDEKREIAAWVVTLKKTN